MDAKIPLPSAGEHPKMSREKSAPLRDKDSGERPETVRRP